MASTSMRAVSLPGCACRGAFQFGVMARLAAAGERFDLVAGASSGSLCGAVTVAGLAARGPDFARELSGAPIVSTRYLATERSVFGVGRILRDTLERNLPQAPPRDTEAEPLVAPPPLGAYAPRFTPARVFRLGGFEEARREPLAIHSN